MTEPLVAQTWEGESKIAVEDAIRAMAEFRTALLFLRRRRARRLATLRRLKNQTPEWAMCLTNRQMVARHDAMFGDDAIGYKGRIR